MAEDRPQTADTPPAAYGLKLNFFKLVVRDIDAMTAFYTGTFGFEIRNRIEASDLVEVMLALPGERFLLVLYQHTDGREIAIGSGHGPVGFLTRDIDGIYAHAVGLGASVDHAPYDRPTMKLAFIRDPEGHEIELIQPKRSV